jgi:hypothetical protein
MIIIAYCLAQAVHDPAQSQGNKNASPRNDKKKNFPPAGGAPAATAASGTGLDNGAPPRASGDEGHMSYRRMLLEALMDPATADKLGQCAELVLAPSVTIDQLKVLDGPLKEAGDFLLKYSFLNTVLFGALKEIANAAPLGGAIGVALAGLQTILVKASLTPHAAPWHALHCMRCDALHCIAMLCP